MRSHVAITGVHFYAHTHVGLSGAAGISGLSRLVDFLIEDAVFEHYTNGLLLDGEGAGHVDLAVRRSLVLDSFSRSSHSQGGFFNDIDGLLLEENVFDHNGWNEVYADSEPTIYNHNLYIQSGVYGDMGVLGCVVRGNVILRGSSNGIQLRPGGLMENNLFVQNSIQGFGNGYFHPSHMIDNVSLDASMKPIYSCGGGSCDGPRGWGLEHQCGSGACVPGSTVIGNIIAHTPAGTNGFIHDTAEVSGNIVWDHPSAPGSYYWDDHWQPGPDPSRDITSYMMTLGSSGGFSAFAAELRQQSRLVWRTEITAPVINDYIRAGFGR